MTLDVNYVINKANISIHTSPKGGDHEFIYLRRTDVISIHTSPKGGDLSRSFCGSTRAEFQSTPPRREVTVGREIVRDLLRISIHTSPKGGDKDTQ